MHGDRRRLCAFNGFGSDQRHMIVPFSDGSFDARGSRVERAPNVMGLIEPRLQP
jgi:hypothetical protein